MKYKPKDRVVYKNKVFVIAEGGWFHDLPIYSIATPDLSEHEVDVPEYKLKPLFLNLVA